MAGGFDRCPSVLANGWSPCLPLLLATVSGFVRPHPMYGTRPGAAGGHDSSTASGWMGEGGMGVMDYGLGGMEAQPGGKPLSAHGTAL